MSRIGKLPITLPAGVEVSVAGTTVTVKGKKGTLTQAIDGDIKVNVADGKIEVTRPTDQKLDDKSPFHAFGVGTTHSSAKD